MKKLTDEEKVILFATEENMLDLENAAKLWFINGKPNYATPYWKKVLKVRDIISSYFEEGNFVGNIKECAQEIVKKL